MKLLQLIRQIGYKDWASAKWAGKPAYLRSGQVRIYSTGNWSFALVVQNGQIQEIFFELEDYASRNTISSILPKVLPYLEAGMGAVYFGGYENYYEMVAEGGELRDWKALNKNHTFVAHTKHPGGRSGKGFIECGTTVTSDLYAFMKQCVEKRIPLDIYDDCSATMSVLSPVFNLEDGGCNIFIAMYCHTAYISVFDKGVWIGGGDHSFRNGSGFEQLNSHNVDGMVEFITQILGKIDKSFSQNDVKRLIFADSGNIEQDFINITVEPLFKQLFSNATFEYRELYKTLGAWMSNQPKILYRNDWPREWPQPPIPLMAYWPTTLPAS